MPALELLDHLLDYSKRLAAGLEAAAQRGERPRSDRLLFAAAEVSTAADRLRVARGMLLGEGEPVLAQPLGSAHVEIGTCEEPPAVVLLLSWPERPGMGIDVPLSPDEARELAAGAEEAAEQVEEQLDELG